MMSNIQHPHQLVRSLKNNTSKPTEQYTMIKELGRKKLNGDQVKSLTEAYEITSNSLLQREIISAIGRQRNEQYVTVLLSLDDHNDPKLTLQILRAISYFKQDPEVQNRIKVLSKHDNEMIQDYLDFRIKPRTSKTEIKNDEITKIENQKYRNKIIGKDSLKSLKKIKNSIIDLTFTSPPYYNARDYSSYKSYNKYLDFLEKVFTEVHRVTREGRFFVLNTSPIIIPRTSRQTSSKRYAIPFDIHTRLIDIGFEFIDDLIWKKPDPSAKNRNGGFFQHRKPLGYKPNVVVEYVMVYRKKTNKLLDWNMRQYDEDIVNKSKIYDDYEMTNVWNIGASTNKNHPAVFPKKLASNIIKYYSYVGDLILDPFAGSGTVGLSCIDNERDYLLIENNPKYVLEMEKMFNL